MLCLNPRYLLSNYEQSVRPVENSSLPLTVEFSVSLHQVDHLDIELLRLIFHINYQIVVVDQKKFFFLFGFLYAYCIIHIFIGRLWTWTRRTRSWRQIVGSLKSGTTLTSLGTSQVVRILHRFVSVYICWHIWQIFHTSSIQILVEWGIFGFPFRRSGGQMWYFTTSMSYNLSPWTIWIYICFSSKMSDAATIKNFTNIIDFSADPQYNTATINTNVIVEHTGKVIPSPPLS